MDKYYTYGIMKDHFGLTLSLPLILYVCVDSVFVVVSYIIVKLVTEQIVIICFKQQLNRNLVFLINLASMTEPMQTSQYPIGGKLATLIL